EMANVYSRLILLTALTVGGCTADTLPPAAGPDTAEPSASSTSPPAPAPPAPASSNGVPAPAEDQSGAAYTDAVDRASGAVSLSQSARSKDDWRLVASRWQQAIALLEGVPEADPNYGAAAQKLTDYRRNLAYAQQQADIPIPDVAPGRVVRLSPDGEEIDAAEADSVTSAATAPPSTPRPQSTTAPSTTTSAGGQQRYQAPIVRRAGGTPVILATFNGNQPFEMIVDTGASGTVITQAMAQALNVDSVGEAKVATASASDVPFQLGYVTSLEVSGVEAGELLVAIAGPDLSVGLLGQDFFRDYDVTIREDVVEFRER
ncbi:MAG: retropepsin-like aspartic protease, partial [Elainellaceae cyanobacterium]